MVFIQREKERERELVALSDTFQCILVYYWLMAGAALCNGNIELQKEDGRQMIGRICFSRRGESEHPIL